MDIDIAVKRLKVVLLRCVAKSSVVTCGTATVRTAHL